MKYKLIKCYPGSPSLETVVNIQGNHVFIYGSCKKLPITYSDITKHPEFWQPDNISLHTNSEIGSLHWLNTIMGRHLRIGEHMSTQLQSSELIWSWGFDIQESSKEIMEYFKDKLK